MKYGHLRHTEKIANTFNLSKETDGISHINKFGKNFDIDNGSVPETVWTGGGLYVPPTQGRTHQFKSTSNNDKGVEVDSGTVTSYNRLQNEFVEVIDSNASFVTDGLVSGDKFIVTTPSNINHTIIVSVDSETQITIQPLHDGNENLKVGDTYTTVTPVSTGAAVVHLFGLNEKGEKIKEFIILNGTTNVPTVNKYLRINRAHTDLTGSSGYNEGIITATADVDATVTAHIDTGIGQTLQAFYTVPLGYTAYITNISLSGSRPTSTSDAMIEAEVRVQKFIPQGKILIVEDNISLALRGGSFTQKVYNPYKVYKQLTDIQLIITYVTDNNMSVNGGFDVILEKN